MKTLKNSNKMFRKLFIIALLVTGPVFCVNVFSEAPPPSPGGSPVGGPGGPVGSAPIDGGLSILLALGAAYGVKRTIDARKKV